MENPTIRFSTFNASLNHSTPGQITLDMSTPNDSQIQKVAEVIQRNTADILLNNEFDYVDVNPYKIVQDFQKNYLSVSQNGTPPIEFPTSTLHVQTLRFHHSLI
jgi:3-phytase